MWNTQYNASGKKKWQMKFILSFQQTHCILYKRNRAKKKKKENETLMSQKQHYFEPGSPSILKHFLASWGITVSFGGYSNIFQ